MLFYLWVISFFYRIVLCVFLLVEFLKHTFPYSFSKSMLNVVPNTLNEILPQGSSNFV